MMIVFVNSLHSTRQFNQLAVTHTRGSLCSAVWVVSCSEYMYSKAHSPILYYDMRVPRSHGIAPNSRPETFFCFI